MVVMAIFFLVPAACWPTGHAPADEAHWKAIAQPAVRLQRRREGCGRQSGELRPSGGVLPGGDVSGHVRQRRRCTARVPFNALRGRPGVRLRRSPPGAVWWRLADILAWSLCTGLIGLAIRTLEARVGVVGRWIVGLIGLAWSVASVFAVPIIVVGAERGPTRSASSEASTATLEQRPGANRCWAISGSASAAC